MYTITNFHPSKQPIPKHIGLIPDGTRRWSKKNNINLYEAYLISMHKIVEYIDIFFRHGSKNVSIYLSSSQNFNRSSERNISILRSRSKANR